VAQKITGLVTIFERPIAIGRLPTGMEAPIKYLFAAAVFNGPAKVLEKILTLETSTPADATFLCVFHRTGLHSNLGDGAHLTDHRAFGKAALKHVCEEHGTDPATVSRVPTPTVGA
jgi:hypothetical protein